VFFPAVAALKRWMPLEHLFSVAHLTTAFTAALMWAVARLLAGSRIPPDRHPPLLCSLTSADRARFGPVAAWVTPTTSPSDLLAAPRRLGRMVRAGSPHRLLLNPVTAGLFLIVACPS
jgi:hypothetical protein